MWITVSDSQRFHRLACQKYSLRKKIFFAEENILCRNIYSLREYIFFADFFPPIMSQRAFALRKPSEEIIEINFSANNKYFRKKKIILQRILSSAWNIFIFPQKKNLPQRLFYFRIEYFHIAWGGAKSLEKYIFLWKKIFFAEGNIFFWNMNIFFTEIWKYSMRKKIFFVEIFILCGNIYSLQIFFSAMLIEPVLLN